MSRCEPVPPDTLPVSNSTLLEKLRWCSNVFDQEYCTDKADVLRSFNCLRQGNGCLQLKSKPSGTPISFDLIRAICLEKYKPSYCSGNNNYDIAGTTSCFQYIMVTNNINISIDQYDEYGDCEPLPPGFY